MGISISSALSGASAAYASPPSDAARNAPQTTNDSADTVKLSESQQIFQLYNRGQSVHQIAGSLSLSVNAVNNYLGIVGRR